MQEEYANGRANLAAGGGRGTLRAEELLQAALKRAGRQDFIDRSFVGSLERLMQACNDEADLSALGLRAVRIDALRCLRNLLRFDALEAESPSILSRPIRAPIFITGMPRSGTTFLHRLILQDPRTVAPRLYQLVYPCGLRTGRFGLALRKSWVSVQVFLFRLLTPELNTLHPVAVDAPEECTDITAHVFQSLRFESMYRVPSYKTWLQRIGFLEAYRFHRRFLQHLDAQLPQPGQWILKSPDHVFALDEIRKVYPDARLVFVHRDPVRVLASVAKLTEVLRRPFTRRIDPVEIGHQVCASWLDGAQRMSALAEDRDGILHLHYRQIVSSPLDVIETVYRHCGLSLPGEVRQRMRAWLGTAAGAGRTGRRYDLGEFGLDPRTLRDRFAHYTETFGVETEREGSLAGIAARP